MSCRKALNHIGGAVAFIAGRQVSIKRYAVAAGHSKKVQIYQFIR